jgi:hypothetical protein
MMSQVLTYFLLQCLVLSLSRIALSCPVLSCLVLTCLVCVALPCVVLFCFVVPCLLCCLALSCGGMLCCVVYSCLALPCLVAKQGTWYRRRTSSGSSIYQMRSSEAVPLAMWVLCSRFASFQSFNTYACLSGLSAIWHGPRPSFTLSLNRVPSCPPECPSVFEPCPIFFLRNPKLGRWFVLCIVPRGSCAQSKSWYQTTLRNVPNPP